MWNRGESLATKEPSTETKETHRGNVRARLWLYNRMLQSVAGRTRRLHIFNAKLTAHPDHRLMTSVIDPGCVKTLRLE
jgi:hypothetical protein